MDFRILGPFEVRDGDRAVGVGGPKQRSLLAILLIHAGHSVTAERLIELLWGDERPSRAEAALQVYVSQLRKALEPDRGRGEEARRLLTRGGGYALRVEAQELDATRFERLASEARAMLAAGEAARAAETLGRALDLWRGPALADFVYEDFAQTEIARLEAARAAAVEDRVEAELALGNHAHLVGELEALVAAHPLRERLRAQLMLALYRAGRQAEALDAYQAARRSLVEELGIEPSPELQRLEQAILRQDPSLAAPAAAPPGIEEVPAREGRRTVTAVFVDLGADAVGGEADDPEALQRPLGRCLATAADVFRRYGASVESFPGAALLGVFGLPELHEDDALRAVRAAVELREALGALDGAPSARIGVATGEAVVPTGGSLRELGGPAVAVARQLREEAEPGAVLLGRRTYELVAHAVTAEPAGAGLRLQRLAGEAQPIVRREDTPFVGRLDEIAQLRAAFDRCVFERAARLVTVLGAPGVGKSRLVRELTAELEGSARVLVGRCLAYGEGITYWPVAEIVGQIAGADPAQGLGSILRGDEHAELVLARISTLVGVGTPGPAEDTHWALRRLLERLAESSPVVLVLEDIHWAEPTLLDLIEYVASFSASSPILLVCVARPELLEARPSWTAPRAGVSVLTLSPLPGPEASELVESLAPAKLPEEVRERIVEAAEGNPLFLEQLVAMQSDTPTEELLVPATLQALLAARVASLPADERSVLERAAVEGKHFHRGILTGLMAPEEQASVGSALVSLVRRGLVRPERSLLSGDDGYRFRHILIRDAAYQALPKRERAGLHARFARLWSERLGFQHDELGEILGYHLEQAYRYEEELGVEDEAAHRELGGAAAAELEAAGRRALARTDLAAAVNLLGRALVLTQEDARLRGEIKLAVATALLEAGRLEGVATLLDELEADARARSDRRLEAHARVERLLLLLQTEPSGALRGIREAGDALQAALEQAEDDLGLARLWRLRALGVSWLELRFADADESLARAAEHAARAGDERERVDLLCWLASSALYGPTPVPEAIARCERLRTQVRPHRHAEARILHPLAALQAMGGDFERAQTLLAEGNAILHDLGQTMHSPASPSETLVALLAGDAARAERRLRAEYERLAAMGEKALFSSTAAALAHTLCVQRRFEEAYGLTETSEQAGAPEDRFTQLRWRAVRARILAQRGDEAAAETLAHEAIALAGATDALNDHADVLLDAADVLHKTGREPEAASLLEHAIELYERKGNAVSASQARALLDGRAVR
jgi:predicted ATPase/DNA-binding SARP family transcriptional activator